MPKSTCTFRRSDVKRLIAAAADAGVRVGRVEIEPTGKISLIPANESHEKAPVANEWDSV